MSLFVKKNILSFLILFTGTHLSLQAADQTNLYNATFSTRRTGLYGGSALLGALCGGVFFNRQFNHSQQAPLSIKKRLFLNAAAGISLAFSFDSLFLMVNKDPHPLCELLLAISCCLIAAHTIEHSTSNGPIQLPEQVIIDVA